MNPTSKIWGFPAHATTVPERRVPPPAEIDSNLAPTIVLDIDTPGHTPRCTTPTEATRTLGREIATPWVEAPVLPKLTDSRPPKPSPRFGHTSVSLPQQEKLLVFGGRCNEAVFDDIWLLSIQVVDDGRSGAPQPAAAALVATDMTPGSLSAATTIQTQAGSPTRSFVSSWEQVFPTPHKIAPIARAGHTAVMTNTNEMLLFGGGDVRTSFLADVWSLDIETFDWSLLSAPNLDSQATYSPVTPIPTGFGPVASPTSQVNDVFPHGRKGHTAVFHAAANEMLVFGGLLSTHRPKFDNSVWAFALETRKWRRCESTGAAPSSCMYHVAELDPQQCKMYVFGGRLLQPNHEHPFLGDLFEYDIYAGVWSKIEAPFAPAPRMCSASLLFNGKILMLHGGSATYMADSFEFDLRTKQWQQLNNVATARTRPTLCRLNNYVILFGGCYQNVYYNDVSVMELRVPSLSQLCHEWLLQAEVKSYERIERDGFSPAPESPLGDGESEVTSPEWSDGSGVPEIIRRRLRRKLQQQ